MESKPFTLIDLFAGAGGFTAGFVCPRERAGHWRALAGIDANRNAVRTFRANFGADIGICADLSAVDPKEYLEGLELSPGDLHLLHASPPCQDFSENNRKNGKGSDDKFRIALNWAETFQPKIVTIENVLNFRNVYDEEIRQCLGEAGYDIDVFELDAAYYGVPQHRRRIFYIAVHRSLNKKPYRPVPTHGDPRSADGSVKPWVTVKEAIGDLPHRRPGQGQAPFRSKLDPHTPETKHTYGSYACSMRPERGAAITGHYARPLSKLALDRIKALQPGQAIAHLPPELRPRDGFRGAYGRMHPHRPSKTITTGIRGPSHGPFCHFSQERLITIREAARLQSFPDAFKFEGTTAAQSLLIGNAVPPLLAQAICSVCTHLLEDG